MKTEAVLLAVVIAISGFSLVVSSEAYGEDGSTGDPLENYIEVVGINGAQERYASFDDLYQHLHGLMGDSLDSPSTVDPNIFIEKSTTKEKFLDFFTDCTSDETSKSYEATVTYTIHGRITFDSSISEGGYLLELGRKAAHFSSNGDNLHMNHFVIQGYDASSELVMKTNITMPYEWWGEKVRSSIEIKNIQLSSENLTNNQLSIGQSWTEGIDTTFSHVKFNGITYYNYVNTGCSLTIDHCVFDACGKELDYPVFAQGHSGLTEQGAYMPGQSSVITITESTFTGYNRGLNIDQATADLTVKKCTIDNKDPGRSSIQLSGFMKAVIEENTLNVEGNAFTLHENMKKTLNIPGLPNQVELKINKNTIVDAGEPGNAYLFYTDISSTFTDELAALIQMDLSNNTIDNTISLDQGIKDGTVYEVTPSVSTDVVRQSGNNSFVTPGETEEPEAPADPSPGYDDDDELPFFPPTHTEPEKDDESVKVVACAAAAVVIVLMSAFLMFDRRS